MSKKLCYFLFFLISLIGCRRNDTPQLLTPPVKTLEIKGADFSFLPKIRQSGNTFRNQEGVNEDMVDTFRKSGGNVVRLRLWVNPTSTNSNFSSVKNLAQELRSKGLKVFLSVHYSDTWADPSQQTKPVLWQNHDFTQLKTDVYNYTKQIMVDINPEYIQIGNEINNGFLWPEGRFSNLAQFKALLQSGISAVHDSNSSTKIVIHFAGTDDALYFFSQILDLSFDIIGISYYPIWHGKDLNALQQNLTTISKQFGKPILLAETSYPFTLGWNDNTNNVVGLNSQILREFPATPIGQKDYLNKIKSIMTEIPKGIGFCYWGADWTAYKGSSATNGSSWENQAFWNFSNQANPVFEVYK